MEIAVENGSRKRLKDLERMQSRNRTIFVLVSLALSSGLVVVNFCLFRSADLFLTPHKIETYSRISLPVLQSTNHTIVEPSEMHSFGYILLFVGFIVTLVSVPVTHLTGVVVHQDTSYHFFQPLKGGADYIMLQAVTWVCYATLICLIGFSLLSPVTHRGLFTLAGVIAGVTQATVTCSLLVFNLDEVEGELKARRRSLSTVFVNKRSDSCSNSNSSEEEGEEEADWPTLVEDLYLAESEYNVEHLLKIDSGTSSFLLFGLLNASLLVCPFFLIFSQEEHLEDSFESHLNALSSFLCIIFAITLTSRVGFRLWTKYSDDGRERWKPFVGGFMFCSLQFIAWMFMFLSLISQIVLIAGFVNIQKLLIYEYVSPKTGITAALIAHVLLTISFRYFTPDLSNLNPIERGNRLARLYHLERLGGLDEKQRVQQLNFIQKTDETMKKLSGFKQVFVTIVLGIMYNIHYMLFVSLLLFFETPGEIVKQLFHIFRDQIDDDHEETPNLFALECFSLTFILFTFMFSILSALKATYFVKMSVLAMITVIPVLITLLLNRDTPQFNTVVFWCVFHVAYIVITYRTTPEKTGSREWKLFQNGFFWNLLLQYYACDIVKDAELINYEKENGALKGTFMVGFHPHGIMPSTVGWVPITSKWRKLFPNIVVRGHTATIIHSVPVLRDMAQWIGMRDVARDTVELSLRHNVSPMLVIGGQSEMFLSSSKGNKVFLHRGHKGFIRLALKYNVPLLPVYSFGEHKLMDNVDLPEIQAAFKKYLGFPVPFIPYGRFFLPLPRRTKLTICIGKPILPPTTTTYNKEKPSSEVVSSLHDKYFDQLEQLFERNKVAAGFPNHSIQWVQ